MSVRPRRAVVRATAALGRHSRLWSTLARTQCRASASPNRRSARTCSWRRRAGGGGLAPLLPEPLVPDYGGANVRGIVPALLGPSSWSDSLPDWMPPVIGESRQVVLLVLDGLGWDQMQSHAALLPTLTGL